MIRLFTSLRRDSRGAALIEFAIISPVFLTVIMGFGELSYQAYVRAVLSGAMQKAGRDSTIQGAGARTDALDQKVIAMVRTVAKNATFSSTRKNYAQFGNIAPEAFTDANANGIRDAGECFGDINGNGIWDADPGKSGQGGAGDVAVYTVTMTYPRLFPVAGWFGWGSNQTLTATTTLKNQPYASQATTAVANICT
ncbi:pilus assembly protein [Sphingomonas gei]|uniref:Pilus assembly protein n=1 Tax=Sphingomonas gei TaxID=1395960 RepID=A0A4S1X979_9SPHN|nr:TadE family protein [Sphingomonas gei]TGX52794.1 pilus assembly protein [Sphingomonas gei]